jgi:hypothetical protein
VENDKEGTINRGNFVGNNFLKTYFYTLFQLVAENM